MRHLIVLTLLSLSSAVLGCDSDPEEPGSEETVGSDIEEIEDLGDDVDEATEDSADAMDEAGEEVEDLHEE